MQRFGHEATEQEIEEMFINSNITRKSYITFYEFVTLITKYLNHLVSKKK